MAGLPGSIKCEQVVMEAALDGDIAPVLASSPSQMSSLADLNKVQVAFLNGGPVVQHMGWKWNRFFPAPFLTNSWQQDYATGTLNIAWLENCQAIDVNNTTVPKPAIDVMAVKDLVATNVVAYPKAICWLPNNQLMYGAWGSAALNNEFGLANPGPAVAYTNCFGANKTPSNPIAQVQDAQGNFWRLNVFDGGQNPPAATCGAFNPFAVAITAFSISANVVTMTAANSFSAGHSVLISGLGTATYLNGQTATVLSAGLSGTHFSFAFAHANASGSDSGTASIVPAYPTYASPSTVATVLVDGTASWQAVNPYAQGFRVSPIPSQTGRVWGLRPVAQAKPVYYTSLESYITPIPDDLYTYFSDGFKILSGMKSSDAKTRAKYQGMYPLWVQSLDNAVRAGNREPDDFYMMPTSSIQQPAWGYASPRPDFPFGPLW